MEKGYSKLLVTRLPNSNSIIIRQVGERQFFISADNVIATDVPSFAFMVKLLVQAGAIDKRVLEGILSELNE
jgi:hypothetical protein